MPMSPVSDVVTTKLVQLALDAASMRHRAIANNIANSNTPGYRPARVSFEEQLGALRAALAQGARLSSTDLAHVRPELLRMAGDASQGARVDADTAVGELAENVVHYQSLLKGLSKNFAILSLAMTEGRR